MADDPSVNTVDRLEIASAIVLAISALLSAWADYQSGLWDGEQAAHYTQANSLHTQASRIATGGDTRQAVEMGLFYQWLNATAVGDKRLANFYQARIPADLQPAFNAWVRDRPAENPSAAPTPFVMPEYKPESRAKVADLERQADKAFDVGQYDNAVSDAFAQSSAIMATALFFGGIGQTFRTRPARIGLLVIAALAVIVGAIRLLGLPIQVLGFGPPTAG